MSRIVTVGATALFTCLLCAAPISLRLSPAGNVSLSEDTASAVIGRPLTPMSVAGVNRRAHRRAYRRDYYGYGYGAYQPYRSYYGSSYYGSGYGTYRPWFGSGYGNQFGYAYQPYRFQQPYYRYGYRNWTEF